MPPAVRVNPQKATKRRDRRKSVHLGLTDNTVGVATEAEWAEILSNLNFISGHPIDERSVEDAALRIRFAVAPPRPAAVNGRPAKPYGHTSQVDENLSKATEVRMAVGNRRR